MKKQNMKILIAVFLGFIVLSVFVIEGISFKPITITIDKTMTKNSLDSMQNALQQKNILLTFSDIEFNSAGFVEKVKGEIKFPFYSGAFGTDDLGKIIISKRIFGIEIKVVPD